MCGIAGLISEAIPEKERENIVLLMNNDMEHRGPDSAGIYNDSLATLGHRRLAIIDLNSGSQPMSFESYHIVFNGEIYNYREVREELKKMGHVFDTTSDTEVILHAFARWGEECVKRLNGMFAFALWDSNQKNLFLARDRTGIKPLYYSRFNNGLVFCSEIPPIFHVKDISKRANNNSLWKFFMFGYPTHPDTAFKDIFELPPACWARCDGKSEFVIKRYWTPMETPSFKGDFKDACDFLDDLLNRVVKEHLVSDVPISSFLSGGIDSSSITALSQKHYNGNIEAFTVRFPDAKYDESRWAKMVADHTGAKHTIIHMDQQPLAIDDIGNILKHVGQPFADSSCIPTYFVCNEAGKNYKVVMSGDGADELFYGYNNFDSYSKIIFLKNFPAVIRKLGLRLTSFIPDLPPANEKIRQLEKALRYSCESEDEAIIYLNSILDPYQMSEFFLETFNKMRPEEFSYLIAGKKYDQPLRKMIQFLFNQSLPQNMLRKVDRMSMRSSIEVRVPFLDHRIVEFAYSLPKEFTIKNGVRKYILRKVMLKYLPEEVFTHKKQGFDIPLHCYYTKEFMDAGEEILLSSNSSIRMFMKEEIIKVVIKGNRDLRTVSKRKYSDYTWSHLLWMMLQFEIWAKKFNVSF